MKVAFSTEGNNLESQLDMRFGRCRNFLVAETDGKAFIVVENGQVMDAEQGAGIQSAQNVLASGADALVTGHCGPKAFKVLQAAGLPVYLGEPVKLVELLKRYCDGTLPRLENANVEGHW